MTKQIPMIWLAGNHDSPGTVDTMRSIPGVTVLGTKTYHTTGYQVSAQYVDADGLVVAGVPDPRVYGSSGAYGSDKDSVTDPLERSAVDTAVKGIAKSMQFDIFATHEPVAAKRADARTCPVRSARRIPVTRTRRTLRVRCSPGPRSIWSKVRPGPAAWMRSAANRPPVEFSIESVAADCQFTKVVRFQLGAAAASATGVTSVAAAASYGQNVTASTIFFKPQSVAPARYCSSASGVGAVRNFGDNALDTALRPAGPRRRRARPAGRNVSACGRGSGGSLDRDAGAAIERADVSRGLVRPIRRAVGRGFGRVLGGGRGWSTRCHKPASHRQVERRCDRGYVRDSTPNAAAGADRPERPV